MPSWLIDLDYRLFTLINSEFTHPWADAFFFWITDLHKILFFKVTVLPLLIFFFYKKFKRKGITLFVFLVLALSVNDFVGGRVKNIFERARPAFNEQLQAQVRSEAGNFSFYSNHASNIFTFAVYTSAFFPAAGVPLFVFAGLVSYSRIYNGVHYPSDVISGLLVGLLFGYLFSRFALVVTDRLDRRSEGK